MLCVPTSIGKGQSETLDEKIRVIFVDPVSEKGDFLETGGTRPSSPRLCLLYLATYVSLLKYVSAKIIEMGTRNLSESDVLHAIYDYSAHIICITSRTFNILGAYSLTEAIKKIVLKLKLFGEVTTPLLCLRKRLKNAVI